MTDAGAGTVDPFNMHTDAAPNNTVVPFNMHTDMVIGDGTNGTLHLSAKNPARAAMSVSITAGMAAKLGEVLRLSGPPQADPRAPAPVDPYNMHTDARTRVSANGTRSIATIEGPAAGPDGHVTLNLTIDGSALDTVKDSHAGI